VVLLCECTHHADFGAEDDAAALGDVVATRAQAVAVQRRADAPPVGEGHQGGAVPGLHDGRVEPVEVLLVALHVGVVLPRLRDAHHLRTGRRAVRQNTVHEASVDVAPQAWLQLVCIGAAQNRQAVAFLIPVPEGYVVQDSAPWSRAARGRYGRAAPGRHRRSRCRSATPARPAAAAQHGSMSAVAAQKMLCGSYGTSPRVPHTACA